MENHWGFSIIVVMDLLASTAWAPSTSALWPHLASLRLLALNLFGWKLPHHWCPPTNGSRPQPLILLSASCCCHTVFGAKLKKPRAPPPARTENYYLLDLWFVHSPVSNAEFGICCPRHRCHPFGAAHPWDKKCGRQMAHHVSPGTGSPCTKYHGAFCGADAPDQKSSTGVSKMPDVPRMPFAQSSGAFATPDRSLPRLLLAKPPVVLPTWSARIAGASVRGRVLFCYFAFLLATLTFNFSTRDCHPTMPLQDSMSPFELRCSVWFGCCCWF